MDAIKLLTVILTIILGLLLILLLVLGIIYISSKTSKKEKEEAAIPNKKEVPKTKKFKEYRTASVMDFMEFDTVVDNMISQKNGNRYVMVVECQGINYDLMSEAEKNSVEEGFIQFLNTLRHPVQIYTQTRTINLDSSIQTYKEKVKEIEMAVEKQEMQYKQMVKSGNYTQEQIDRAYFELTKEKNLYEYGKDIIFNTERMSLNKNILNKKYYVVISYYSEEAGNENLAKEEIRELAFSELYTRAQAIIRALAVSGVNGKVMSSTELADLLYVAYNREDSDSYGIDKAIKAGYNEMYSTGQDYMEKKMQLLDEDIARQAMELANNKVIEVQSEKQNEYLSKVETKEDIINNLAQLIIEENEAMLGKDVAERAKDKVRKEKAENGKEE